MILNGRIIDEIAYHKDLSADIGRKQFNFTSGNFSEVSDEDLRKFITKTNGIKPMKNVNVIWVGLSAKMASGAENCAPLHINTNTGKLVAEIETLCHGANFYKTNLVKFPPLDSKGKLRYPTSKECALCYPELQIELKSINPRVVLLLGNKTATFVLHQLGLQMPKLSFEYQVLDYEGVMYMPIHHPSYILVYRRKEKDRYVQAVKAAIERLI